MSEGKIFVVDDTPDNVDLLTRILSRAGYEVSSADGGQKALEIIERDPPELVMLDIQMPGMDGYEVCRRLKEDRALAAIPVIFVSALDDVSDKVKGLGLGAVAVAWWVGLSRAVWGLLVLASCWVIILEGLNTAVEAAVDLASPDVHPLAKSA